MICLLSIVNSVFNHITLFVVLVFIIKNIINTFKSLRSRRYPHPPEEELNFTRLCIKSKLVWLCTYYKSRMHQGGRPFVTILFGLDFKFQIYLFLYIYLF